MPDRYEVLQEVLYEQGVVIERRRYPAHLARVLLARAAWLRELTPEEQC